ncbi:MAG: hypothetical protein A2V66_16910 [Ignavibacteria bacterium RBG_13_36_8]|nr:MAG: hypothetical protein A2V66_16910 [Ignavibacteria bacterium RBG_13_36_8]
MDITSAIFLLLFVLFIFLLLIIFHDKYFSKYNVRWFIIAFLVLFILTICYFIRVSNVEGYTTGKRVKVLSKYGKTYHGIITSIDLFEITLEAKYKIFGVTKEKYFVLRSDIVSIWSSEKALYEVE